MGRRLGAPTARLHADDVGWNETVNTVTESLLTAGLLAGLSIVANGAAIADAAEMVLRAPWVPVHLHLNLTEGQALACRHELGELVDAEGEFLGLRRMAYGLVRGQIGPGEIQRELNAQLDRLAAFGLKVSAIDSHHHVHAFSPVSEVVDQVAAERGLARGRSYDLMRTHTMQGWGKKVMLAGLARLTSQAAAGQPRLPSSWSARTDDTSRPFTVASWERLRTSVYDQPTTIVCHPGGECDRPAPRVVASPGIRFG